MGIIKKLAEASERRSQKRAEKRAKRQAALKARTRATIEVIKKGKPKPAVTPVKPVSTQPATSAKPVAVTPK